jgi:hypothetical protein
MPARTHRNRHDQCNQYRVAEMRSRTTADAPTTAHFVAILSQDHSGGAVITRLLNEVPGVRISAGTLRALDHLCHFAVTMKGLDRHRRSEVDKIVWQAPAMTQPSCTIYHGENSPCCYWLPCEELKSESGILRGMYDFLGIAFKPEYLRPLDVSTLL